MRRFLALLAAAVIGAGCLGGCAPAAQPGRSEPTTLPGETTEPTVPVETAEVPAQTEPTAAEPRDLGDTYWVGTSWGSEDTGEEPFVPESWSVDLLVRADGTARFRDIHEGVSLTDDSLLDLAWTQDQDGFFVFFGQLLPELELRGRLENDRLTLDYYGLTVTMEEKPMPRTPGELAAPAELAGTWLMVSGETEGYVWEAMPARLDSVVFRVDSFDGPLMLAADVESRDRFGWMEEAEYRQRVTVLEEPLYPGCENEVWSVRIGEASPVDSNGCPLEPELYATLLDYNTMLVQTNYTFDGYPAVSYQTYWRFPSIVSWMSPEAMELELTNWTCREYRDPDGVWGPVPEELEKLELVLDTDGSCCLFPDGQTPVMGTWTIGTGGVLLLDGGDDFWFGGAVSGWYRETEAGGGTVYEMTLYYAGGLLRLQVSSYG